MRATLAFVAACLLTVASSALGADFPRYTGYVNDFGNLLTAEARAGLEALLRDNEKETTAEVVLATVPSLDGMSVEEYANRLFNEWGIGKKKTDNGVLIVVAPNEREMRIEVGYGLEGILPDGLAGQIIREEFLPHFRNDDYPGGIDSGVRRVVDVVRRNHVLTAEERAAIEEAAQDRAPWFLTVPFFGAFVGIGFYMVGLGFGSKTGFPLLFGSFFGGMPLLMSLVPVFNTPWWVMVPWALVVAILGFRSGRRGSSFAQSFRQGKGRKGGSASHGWVMGGGSSSGGSSSGSSSSGSFGGGSSGGGGASGRW